MRKLLTEIADKPAEREKHIENLLMILPRGSADPLKVIRPKPEKKEGEEDDDDFGEEVVEEPKAESEEEDVSE